MYIYLIIVSKAVCTYWLCACIGPYLRFFFASYFYVCMYVCMYMYVVFVALYINEIN